MIFLWISGVKLALDIGRNSVGKCSEHPNFEIILGF